MLLCILEQVTQHDMADMEDNLGYYLMLLKEAAAQESVSSQVKLLGENITEFAL